MKVVETFLLLASIAASIMSRETDETEADLHNDFIIGDMDAREIRKWKCGGGYYKSEYVGPTSCIAGEETSGTVVILIQTSLYHRSLFKKK